MGCQCMCSQKGPPDSIPKSHSPFGKYQGAGGEENYFVYKVAVVGDADTGKTSMLGKFAGDGFNPTYTPTIGVDFRICNIEVDEVRIKLQVWDISGLPRFIRYFYRDCIGIIVTYNATKEKTFENVPYWIEELSKERYRYYPNAKIIVLVGTNGDRVDEKVVDYTRARDFASERQIPFFEVSSKDGTNVELAFMTLVAQLRQLQIELEKK